MSNSIGHNLIHHNLLALVVLEHQSKINSSCISGYNLFQVQANSQIRKSHITSKFWGTCLNLRKTKLPMGTNRVISVFPQSVLATDPTSKLQGNPLCLNTNLVLFCGPQNENETVSHTPSATNSNDNCLVQSCPYEYAPNSPCFCAVPLIVGYWLKSPGFRYFEPYWVPFEINLSAAPRTFDLRFKESCSKPTGSRRSYLTSGTVVDDAWIMVLDDLSGGVTLILKSATNMIPSSTSKSGISKGALAGIVVGTVAGVVILSTVVSLLIWRLHMNKYTAVSKRRRLIMHSPSKTNVRAQVTAEVGNVNNKHFVLALKVKSMLDPCEDENDDIQDDDVSLGADFVQRDEHSESVSEVSHSQDNQYIVAPIAVEL
ncbi:unnamed protein product [Camellia sinensis]